MNTVADIRQLPELGDDSIHIWGVQVTAVLGRLDRLKSVLCRRELDKAARYQRESDRNSSIAARGALRILLSGYSAVPASALRFEYSENGKPYLAVPGGRRAACNTLSFNVSHSADWVVLAIGRNRRIGVDVEQIRPELDVLRIAARYFTAEELARLHAAEEPHAVFFQLWARKEAYVKAAGSALFRELHSFAVPLDDVERNGWHFRRLEAGSSYAAAVVSDKPSGAVACYDFGGMKWDS